MSDLKYSPSSSLGHQNETPDHWGRAFRRSCLGECWRRLLGHAVVVGLEIVFHAGATKAHVHVGRAGDDAARDH